MPTVPFATLLYASMPNVHPYCVAVFMVLAVPPHPTMLLRVDVVMVAAVVPRTRAATYTVMAPRMPNDSTSDPHRIRLR